MVSVCPDESMFCGRLGEMVTPAGRFPAERDTDPENPFSGVMLALTVVDLPATSEMLEGLSTRPKSAGGGGGVLPPPLPPPPHAVSMQSRQAGNQRRNGKEKLDTSPVKAAPNLLLSRRAYNRNFTFSRHGNSVRRQTQTGHSCPHNMSAKMGQAAFIKHRTLTHTRAVSSHRQTHRQANYESLTTTSPLGVSRPTTDTRGRVSQGQNWIVRAFDALEKGRDVEVEGFAMLGHAKGVT